MMNTKLPAHVIAFAGSEDNAIVYEQFKDYYFHYMDEFVGKKLGKYDSAKDFSEKESKMDTKLMAEVQRVYGNTIPKGITFEQFSSNPQFVWATFAVVSNMIDAIIPDTIMKDIGIFTDIKPIPMGGSYQIDLAPNSLMTISQGSNSRRTTWAQKEFKGSHTLTATNHTFTVELALYKILSGEASLAEFVRKAVISMETEMTSDAYSALNTLIEDGSFPSALKPAGYSVENLIEVCQKVEAYNRSKPVIVGTKKALYNILPDSADGYRINTNAEAPAISVMKGFFEWDIIELKQLADTSSSTYGLLLDDTKIYVISTGTDKIIKGVIEGGTYSVALTPEQTANLTASQTMNKRWGFEAVSNSTIGCLVIS